MSKPIHASDLQHFQAPKGWINDPNGLVYCNETYHLFYQHHPDGMTWGPMHWGHATSKDLETWSHKPITLVPDELGACFSGSAVVDWKDSSGLFKGKSGLVAFYTVHRELDGFDRGYIQDQCIAYSSDGGESWTKYENNPVLLNPGFSDFRDPKVFWHEESQHWIMCLATRQSISFYRSKNLTKWQFCSEFGEGQGAHEWHPWECPDLFKLTSESGESAWVLIVGIGMSPDVHFGSYTQYFVGSFDGKTFTNANNPETILYLDEGRDYYATQSWSDAPNGARLGISWMNNWRYANEIPAVIRRGQMGIPRSFKLVSCDEGLRVAQSFAPEIALDRLLEEELNDQEFLTLDTATNEHGKATINFAVHSVVELRFASATDQINIARTETGFTIQMVRISDSSDLLFKENFSHDYTRSFAYSSSEITIEWLVTPFGVELLLADGLVSVTQLFETAGLSAD
ncbi:glycoside hydrolase family 32 protein [Marinobacterium sp. LSUCC0821]|uniref:glycoside hydrolase family 32 protein n=1 Tax=Marinobacterium sp. LSUCC0821 TaxID=2668067 RepID=UPI001451691C|nr:glycoside hydrolase family 32 protein [Marinobacterium sp. LSUCC0821]QJD71107.1 glycoside hydrolase family 32 protein [Marinobacterium sp. LSUCC0821]